MFNHIPPSGGSPEPPKRFGSLKLRTVDVLTKDGARRTFTHADLSGDASVGQITDAVFAAFSDVAAVRIDGGLWHHALL